MRALTVRQPWAWAIIHGGKDVENRSRSLGPYRGPVAIHAGLTDAVTDAEIDESALSVLYAWRRWWTETGMPGGQRGHIIGVVDLVDVHECDWAVMDEERMSCCLSRWAQYPPDADVWHHLVLANPRPLVLPIPWRGAQGLWRVPAELEAQIREQVTL